MNLDKLSCCFKFFPIYFRPFSLFGAASQSPFQDVLHHSQKTLLALCIAALYLSNINREITSLASNTEIRTVLQSSKALVHPAFRTSRRKREETTRQRGPNLSLLWGFWQTPSAHNGKICSTHNVPC